jgi:hypothetical protein
MSRNGQAPEIVEQVAFVDVGLDGISQIDLLCSGFMADEAVASCPAIMLGSSAAGEVVG